MAALCTGISYGLSQNCSRNENKELIFLKLTEAASRAIDELQKNHEQLSSATIQFLGNEGCLSFPSKSKNGGFEQFRFSIGKTEGQEGSFECVQQTNNQLEVLGALPSKMRIHANDDVYEHTKHRMAVAEETQKNKCTREIKPNQKDIGRKVKVKPNLGRISNIPSATSSTLGKPRDSSASSSALASSASSSAYAHSSALYNNHPGAHLLSAGSSPPLKNGSSPSSQYNHHQPSNNNNNSTSLATSNHNSATNQHNLNNSSMPMTTNNSSSPMSSSSSSTNAPAANNGRVAHSSNVNNNPLRNPDLMKRPIKERLIHILAVRPFKKPELYHRLQNEGVRDREKNLITNVLKAISDLIDNTYHLKRRVWNDVNEDWQFYSEQDKQSLKRRKPQNLTPPLSSDGGSSTSGQSPTSTHNGSPPPPVKRPSMSGGGVADKYVDSAPTSKKQRISHCQQSSSATLAAAAARSRTSSSSYGNGSLDALYGSGAGATSAPGASAASSSRMLGASGSAVTQSSAAAAGTATAPKQHRRQKQPADGRDGANLNPRSRESTSSSAGSSSAANQRVSSPMAASGYYSHSDNDHGSGSGGTGTSNGLSYGVLGADATRRFSPASGSNQHSSSSSHSQYDAQSASPSTHNSMNNNNNHTMHGSPHMHGSLSTPTQSGGSSSSSSVSTSPDGASIMRSHALNPNNAVHGTAEKYDFSAWTQIANIDQRRRYKSEFDQNYAEYRKLHLYQDDICKRFQLLETQLKQEKRNGNETQCTIIRNKIQEEYRNTMSYDVYKNNVERFNYLHHKLSHIKKLVSEFDSALKRSKAIAKY